MVDMPESIIRKRGGAIRYRTIELGDGEYKHCAITKKSGPRGGRVVCGPTRKKKLAYA